MALPTLQDAKDYLRVDSSTDDGLLTKLLARSLASIERHIGYPITALALSYTDFTDYRAYMDRPYARDEIQLPGPFALAPAPIVTDAAGTVIDATNYLLDPLTGKIRAKLGSALGYGFGQSRFFSLPPYTVVATVGLSAHPDYAARLESVASIAILDLVTHYYENRNPMIADDQGAGVNSVTPAMPPRIASDLLLLPCTRGLLLA